jgi:hypothetical protein
MRVKERKDLTLEYWRDSVVSLLQYSEQPILTKKGSVSNEQMEKIVKRRYEIFDQRRREEAARLDDEADMKYLKEIQKQLDRRKNN